MCWDDIRGYFVQTWQQRYEVAGITLPFVLCLHGAFCAASTIRKHSRRATWYMFCWAALLAWPLIAATVQPLWENGLRLSSRSRTSSSEGVRQHGAWLCGHERYRPFPLQMHRLFLPEDAAATRWNDPAIGIEWPATNPQRSAKEAPPISGPSCTCPPLVGQPDASMIEATHAHHH